MSDQFGDRMKMYEKLETQRFMPLLPICVRLDGKGFSKFTKNMRRPYDERMSNLMQATTKFLVEESVACAGYTQSDEISLVYYSDKPNSQVFFDGKIQKVVSVLASMCSTYFNLEFSKYFPDGLHKMAFFDCRAWVVPNLTEATNVFLWRELDATKNAVSMAAHHYYSHNELHGKGQSDMQEMLFSKGVNFNKYPAFFKRGTYALRKRVDRPFSSEELDKLPPMHDARKNPALTVSRQEVVLAQLPRLTSVTNREAVLFNGADPEVFGLIGVKHDA